MELTQKEIKELMKDPIMIETLKDIEKVLNETNDKINSLPNICDVKSNIKKVNNQKKELK
jgi:uncharacterized UPF0160 family protein